MSEIKKPTESELAKAFRHLYDGGGYVASYDIGRWRIWTRENSVDKTSRDGQGWEDFILEWYRKKTRPTREQMGEFLMRQDVRKLMEHGLWEIMVGRYSRAINPDHDEAIIAAMRAEGVI